MIEIVGVLIGTLINDLTILILILGVHHSLGLHRLGTSLSRSRATWATVTKEIGQLLLVFGSFRSSFSLFLLSSFFIALLLGQSLLLFKFFLALELLVFLLNSFLLFFKTLTFFLSLFF